MNRGSTWNKWNFHVHTKGTNKNDQFTSPTMDEFFAIFFQKALNADVSVIAITDYFSIENYQLAVDYVRNMRQKVDTAGQPIFNADEISRIKKILLLPNVELRMLPTTGNQQLVNIHCIFNPSILHLLDNHFFSALENERHCRMNRAGISEYGRMLQPGADERTAYRRGIDAFAIDIRGLIAVMEKPELKENTLVVVSNKTSDGVTGIVDHYKFFETEPGALTGVRDSIYQTSNAIFSARPKDILFFLGQRLDRHDGVTNEQRLKEQQDVILEKGSLKACLVGCDAHTEDELFTKFTWVKGRLDYNGLRQIIFEPKLRVKIQPDMPDQKDPKLVIDHVKFISPLFTPEVIYLNPNLNVIIGGKSSGKTILLYEIAKTLLPDRSPLKKAGTEQYRYEFGAGFDFEVTIGTGNTQKASRADSEASILPQIKYIPQNHLATLVEPENKKGNELVKHIRDLLREDPEADARYQSFLGQVKANDARMENLINGYFTLSEEGSALLEGLAQMGNDQVLKDSISANLEAIQVLKEKAGLSAEQITEYNGYIAARDDAQGRLIRLNEEVAAAKKFHDEASAAITSLVARRDAMIQAMTNQEAKDFYTAQYGFIHATLQQLRELDKNYVTDESVYFVEDHSVGREYRALRQRRDENIAQLGPLLQGQENEKKIDGLQKAVDDDKAKLEAIDRRRQEITAKQTAIADQKKAIFDLYEENYNQYLGLITAFDHRTQSLAVHGLTLEGNSKFNFPKFRQAVADHTDYRRITLEKYPLLDDKKDGTTDYVFAELKDAISIMFTDIAENRSYPMVSKANAKGLTKILLADYFYDYWDAIYQSDHLTNMSTGKASFVLLMLIVGLSASKAPILIDQPEDNLDNRSITKDLVEYLRDRKLERQIILVTHNANVVVNADAENIIVANQQGQNGVSTSSPYKFDYINGALEESFAKKTDEDNLLKSMGIRQHVTDILEGGDDAFLKREKKYGFPKR